MSMRISTVVAVICATLMAVLGCEGDPSQDSDNPAPYVPLNPSRPEPPSGEVPLALEAQLVGQYADGLAITGGSWNDVGSRRAIQITFSASGMVGIGQFDVVLTPDPPTQFDIALSQFVPEPPFLTLGTGVEQLDDGSIRFIGVNFQRTSNGAAVLGTINLRTEASFSVDHQVELPVSFFSIGPTSADRDSFQQADINVGVIINSQ
jgi:hypothetical protein